MWKAQRIGRITSSVAHRTLAKARKLDNNSDVGNMENLVDVITGQKVVDPNVYALRYGRKWKLLLGKST